MVCLGVVAVFLAQTSRIRTASGSNRQKIRQVTSASMTRNSWHRLPIWGMGRDFGMASNSPR